MDDKQIKSKINEGFLHVRTIIQIMGRPVEHVQDTLKTYVEKIKNDTDLIILTEDYEKVTPVEDMFTVFGEIELLVKGAAKLVQFCFDYMPASVEILEPEKVVYESIQFTDFLNDMQARLHTVNMSMQDIRQKKENMAMNIMAILENFVITVLNSPKSVNQIHAATGMPESDVTKILNSLLHKERIIQKGDIYALK